MLTVTFKWLHDFNSSFDKKQPCKHLFKELKPGPTVEFAVELELFPAFGNL